MRWTWLGPPFFWLNAMTIPADIEAITIQVLNRYGCDLVMGTFRPERQGLTLRLLIERRGASPNEGSGVDLGLCSSISRDLSAQFDMEDIIDKQYVLEISSPGLERPLIKPEDYERFKGREIRIKTTRAIGGRRKFKGLLKGLSRKAVNLSNGDGSTIELPFKSIEKANLVFEPNGFGAKVGD